MTREEAIYQLEDLKKEAMSHFWCEKDDCANDDKIHHRDAEALDMAIAALRVADGANAAARVKKPRAPKMTCDEMLQNLKSIAKKKGGTGDEAVYRKRTCINSQFAQSVDYRRGLREKGKPKRGKPKRGKPTRTTIDCD